MIPTKPTEQTPLLASFATNYGTFKTAVAAQPAAAVDVKTAAVAEKVGLLSGHTSSYGTFNGDAK